MKRTGHLMEKIADPDNLRLAYWKARRGKEHKPEVVRYRSELDTNLAALRRELLSGDVSTGNYFYFRIHDPKERMICAASFPERVLHHAMMNVCHQVFERFQIYGSYATRPGKGQYAALDRAREHTRRYRWFCKLDVRKFFDSIDHGVLYRQLRRKFKDREVLALFRRILDSYETAPGRGLPIGNLTSQYFANFHLGHADHHVLERVGVPAYVRYMDDMLLWHDDKAELIRIAARLSDYIGNELRLTLKPACLNRAASGVPFLGYVLFPWMVRLNKNSKKRFVCKMKRYDGKLTGGEWTEETYVRHIEPLVAFTRYADAQAFRRTKIFRMGTG